MGANSRPLRILTIAGSDSGGGAGIQADIRTITALGGFTVTVVTALTAQNTRGVCEVHAAPTRFVTAQLDAVMRDIGADAAKTGMLPTAAIVRAVAEGIRGRRIRRLVADPVLVSQSGDRLIPDAAMKAVARWLLPLAHAVTPNLREAEALAGMRVDSPETMRQAARRIYELGPRNVVVKGGHLRRGPAVDILFDGRDFHEFSAPRLPRGAHGSGCAFAATLATLLGKGMDARTATAETKKFIARAIRCALRPGKGQWVINPGA